MAHVKKQWLDHAGPEVTGTLAALKLEPESAMVKDVRIALTKRFKITNLERKEAEDGAVRLRAELENGDMLAGNGKNDYAAVADLASRLLQIEKALGNAPAEIDAPANGEEASE